MVKIAIIRQDNFKFKISIGKLAEKRGRKAVGLNAPDVGLMTARPHRISRVCYGGFLLFSNNIFSYQNYLRVIYDRYNCYSATDGFPWIFATV